MTKVVKYRHQTIDNIRKRDNMVSIRKKEKRDKFLQCSMTKTKLKTWMKEAKHISTDYYENDSDGNCWARDIFEKNGEYYAVESINGKPISHIKVDKNGKAIKDGNFAPKKVNFTRYNAKGEPA
jgi:hypothetical protein